MLQDFTLFNQTLGTITQPRALINTINAHSFNTLRRDKEFDKALRSSDILLPDGISIVLAMRLLTGEKLRKIAGIDLFLFEMQRMNTSGGTCFFLGSSDETLNKIKRKAAIEYPNVRIHTYSPPYKPEFSEEDTRLMLNTVNAVQPDVLFVGMTAPKQEKWAHNHFEQLKAGHVCGIGAVFDFYAGTIKRAPDWMILIGMEWSYRLIKEPRRMWRRYLIGNTKFIGYVIMEKIRVSR